MNSPLPQTPDTRTIAARAIPALLVGVGSALILIGVSRVAEQLQHFLWSWLPSRFDVGADSCWWMVGVLTATGVAVGLVVWKMPGRAGPDPATVELVGPPQPLRVLPSLALALVLGLAGGVSLGPENPIIAINVAVSVWVIGRLWHGAPTTFGVILGASGTIGALFGTPVAAALLLTEMKQMHSDGRLWDKLFAPLVAAGAGALTMHLLGSPQLSVTVPAYADPQWIDLVSAIVITLAAALLGVAAIYVFHPLHRLLHALPNPLIAITLGGMGLGLLGALGGKITLFKGVDEMKELTATAADHSTAGLIVIAVVKLAALVVAAACGFRGGHIFPAVFVGVAAGLVAHSVAPGVPLALAIGSGVLALTMVVSRDGWVALFLGATVVGDIAVLPVLCLAILPLWLLISARPEMTVRLALQPTPAPER
ncbi:ion channel protein [Speluncibacter jeojiensis]|uniref:ion channel protein n=1 Tax=Speluncibacter jeojiensis TaxID=2710754 RepID=UPI0024100C27|nr:ion channel protein [Rhodococcus sp. D2-41]